MTETAERPRAESGVFRASVQVRHDRARAAVSPLQRAVLIGVGVASAVLAVSSGAQPTGQRFVDIVYLGCFGGAMVAAGSQARRWALVVAAALCGSAAVASSPSLGLSTALALGALSAAVALGLSDLRHAVVGGVIGALLTGSVLRLEIRWADRGSALIGFVVVALVAASAATTASRTTRYRLKRAAIVCSLVVLFAIVAAGVAGWRASRPLQSAVVQTVTAVEMAGNGETDGATAGFERASRDFELADDITDAWWTKPIALVPVLSQNFRAAHVAASAGVTLTGTAADVTDGIRYDRLRQESGGINLSVLAEFRSPVLTAASKVRSASRELRSLDSPWIVGPLSDRLDEFRSKLRRFRRESELAADAVRLAPALLGEGGDRRYLVLLGNPAELRDLGGHIGNWAELSVRDGRIDLGSVGSPLELSRPEGETRVRERPDLFPPSLLSVQPARYPQNWGGSPDFEVDARAAAELYRLKVGHSVDGVVYADPAVLAAMLEVIGPVGVPGQATRVSADNVVDYLTRRQFSEFADDSVSDDALKSLITEIFDRFTTVKLPGPRALSAMFTPVVRSGRLRFVSLHSADRPLLKRLGLDVEAVPEPGDDLLGIVNRNVNPSKIDVFLHRSSKYDVVWDPTTGEVQASVTIELRNDAPAKGLPAVVIGNGFGGGLGTNRTDVTVITPLTLADVFVDGLDTPVGSLEEGRLRRHTVRVELPPGGERTIVFRLTGVLASGSRYRLAVMDQPILNGGTVDVVVRTTGPTIGVPKGFRLGPDGVRIRIENQVRRDVVLFAR